MGNGGKSPTRSSYTHLIGMLRGVKASLLKYVMLLLRLGLRLQLQRLLLRLRLLLQL